MTVEDFFLHYGITENPFKAEEARHDPIFQRLIDHNTNHPDFAKILGQISEPSTAIVFGEKGSGKTAIRLLIGRKVAEHNATVDGESQDASPGHVGRTLLVAYDDFNPILDRFIQHRYRDRRRGMPSDPEIERLLSEFRLVDHQDAILSRAVTRLTSAVLGDQITAMGRGGDDQVQVPHPIVRHLKRMPRRLRLNLAMLAALYDQPADGNVMGRWQRLRHRLRLGWRMPIDPAKLGGVTLTIAAAGLAITYLIFGKDQTPWWLMPAMGLTIAAAVALLGLSLWRTALLWRLCRRIRREMPTVDRLPGELRSMLRQLRSADMAHQPWPIPQAGSDTRYDLTRRLLDVLEGFGYAGVVVLIDRVDEPTLISGKPERMRSIVWPMFDNKFLQQQGIGLKLLLPVELRYLLMRESAEFFQEARLDKQNLIDRLTWSGATLYDLCTSRLRACRQEAAKLGGASAPQGEAPSQDASPPGASAQPLQLTDLFESDVNRAMLVDALDQMHQPRDAFKFLYAVVQEHCRMVSRDEAIYRIPRLTLEAVRRQQAQRVQELYRGHAPA